MSRSQSPPRIATVDDASEVGRLLHDFNTEFETLTPGAAVLEERLTILLAGPSMFAILVGEPAIAVALVSVRPNIWYEGTVGLSTNCMSHQNYAAKESAQPSSNYSKVSL